jgi:hypothetical protein
MFVTRYRGDQSVGRIRYHGSRPREENYFFFFVVLFFLVVFLVAFFLAIRGITSFLLANNLRVGNFAVNGFLCFALICAGRVKRATK